MSQVLRNYVPLRDRCTLAEARVTLNGERAEISGLMDKLATVTAPATGEHYRWSWSQVEYIITELGGQFRGGPS